VATISAGTGVMPLPGVGGVVDSALLVGTIHIYFRQLGLKETPSINRSFLNEKYREIIDKYISSTMKDIVFNVAASLGTLTALEEICKYIPLIGLGIAMGVGFAKTLRYLIKTINELEEVAMAVWENAAKRSIEERSK
jgi:hypothetical protein